MRRRVHVEPDHVAQLGGEAGSLDSLKVRTRCGASPCAAQIRCTERKEMPAAFAIARPVQWVASPGGSRRVSSTTRSTVAAGSGGVPGFGLAPLSWTPLIG